MKVRAPAAQPLLLGLALLSAAGCARFQPTPTLMAANEADQVQRDLPVPEGFELDRDATLRHERSAYRRLHLVYRRDGYLSQERVSEFVRNVYPKVGWEVRFVYGLEPAHVVLHKGHEECRVAIREDSGDGSTELVLDIEPRQTPDGALVARGFERDGFVSGSVASVETSVRPTSVPAGAARGTANK